MHEFRLRAAGAAKANVGAARLERFVVRAGRNLAKSILRRQPDFDVIGLGIAETEIPGRKGDDPIMNPEPLQNGFGVARQRLEFVVRMLRQGIFHQLDLLELMLADYAARVLAVTAGLGTKAWRVSDPLHRQL